MLKWQGTGLVREVTGSKAGTGDRSAITCRTPPELLAKALQMGRGSRHPSSVLSKPGIWVRVEVSYGSPELLPPVPRLFAGKVPKSGETLRFVI